MPGVKNGAELVQKLALTGTGANKLAGPRKFLEDIHRVEGRIATATEVYGVMESGQYEVGGQKIQVQPSPEATLVKARELMRTGEWNGPPQDLEQTIEEKLLGLKPATLVEKLAAAPEPVKASEVGVVPAEKPGFATPVGLKPVKKAPLKSDLKVMSEAKE